MGTSSPALASRDERRLRKVPEAGLEIRNSSMSSDFQTGQARYTEGYPPVAWL
jgi:hypothetical protein